jgi:hypothetical protein
MLLRTKAITARSALLIFSGSIISEPKKSRRCWQEDKEAQGGKALLRLRAERVERTFAHLYETGRMRRTHLRGRLNILKRILIHVNASNLGFLMRVVCGTGTPRNLQGRCMALFSRLFNKSNVVCVRIAAAISIFGASWPAVPGFWLPYLLRDAIIGILTFSAGCYPFSYTLAENARKRK